MGHSYRQLFPGAADSFLKAIENTATSAAIWLTGMQRSDKSFWAGSLGEWRGNPRAQGCMRESRAL